MLIRSFRRPPGLRPQRFVRCFEAGIEKDLRDPRRTEGEGSPGVVVTQMPPLVARAALVGTAVGLASPLFGVGGVAWMWFNYLPRTSFGATAKYVAGLSLGGGFSVLMYQHIIPFLSYNSEFVLPFAVANGVSAAALYVLGEKLFGIEALKGEQKVATTSQLPPGDLSSMGAHIRAAMSNGGVSMAAGPVIGGLTALISPFLWPSLFLHLWSTDLQSIVLGTNP